ncbi:hypothetical protein A1O3_03803 [Capronia epimyces CBS 606.96]|uniref:Uncharacterized protein n=1 Tax=Capronia epimyces CBS 606.96 TaxID=1182542 RepID=W9YX52_9EURO|nr:uncharacterized protein A1O3_03803 [Capronia epimyces CBS 606.96]EXJ86849.1 hypothetical protein A1O3_03803 [Capronia epimyces CBS 606.96]
MPSQQSGRKGRKRRWVVQRFEDLLRLPANAPQPSNDSSRITHLHSHAPITPTEPPGPVSDVPSTNLPSTHNHPVDITTDETPQPDEHILPTVHQPTAWLRGVDIDRFQASVMGSYTATDSDTSLGQITIFGDEPAHSGDSSPMDETSLDPRQAINHGNGSNDDSTSDDSEASSALGSKGFSPLFDTGAQVSIIPETTLARMKKGYTKTCHLPPQQRDNMTLADFKGNTYHPVGLVPLLWCLDDFPEVSLNTTFWVVDGKVPNDLIIGKDVLNAVDFAVMRERQFRSKGPSKGPVLKKMKAAIRNSSVRLLRPASSGSLHSRPHH